jgi:transcriptional regulator with XRE-family HTH domain
MRNRTESSHTAQSSPLRQLREAKGYTAEDLAYLAGVSSRTVYALEAGANFPRRATQRVLADALGCSPQDLINDPDRAANAAEGKVAVTTRHAARV